MSGRKPSPDALRKISPNGIDIIDDNGIPSELSKGCNRLTDQQWEKFFIHYLTWIRDNFDNCLEKIPKKITFDNLSVLPFDEGGFDLKGFITENERPTSQETARITKTSKLYDDYLENIKTLKENGEGTFLTALNRNVLYNLCTALQKQLKEHTIFFYLTMIFLMEIMMCGKVFDAFIEDVMTSSSKSYYDIISKCKLQVFGIEKNNNPSRVNNTVGYFIINYARRLLKFTIKYEKQYPFIMRLPVPINIKYTANLKVAIGPDLIIKKYTSGPPTPKAAYEHHSPPKNVKYTFVPGQNQKLNPFYTTKELEQLLELNPNPKVKREVAKKSDEPVAKRTRTKRGGNHIKNKLVEYKEKLKINIEHYKLNKSEKALLVIKKLKDKINLYKEKLKLIK
jgi:hypothetical protein